VRKEEKPYDFEDVDPKRDRVDPDQFLPRDKKLSLDQQRAVEMACEMEYPIVGITGGAGTGKTTVLGALYKELRAARRRVVVAAPTGRAAKRVTELTKIPAITIHRLLEYPQPDQDLEGNMMPNEPSRNRQRPLEAQVVIIDESSMVSPTLYGQIMDALPRGSVVRFIGDNNQLPPVEEGKPPFIDVLERYPSVVLHFNYRSQDDIVSNAGRILRGMIPKANDRFHILYTNDMVSGLLDFVTGSKEFARDDHQIIIPARKGRYGTLRVNPSLQLKFNPRGDVLHLDRYDEKEKPLTVRGGDKFLWIKNDYKLNMFNGEIGRIADLDSEQGWLKLRTTDREILVEPRIKTYSSYHGFVIDYDPRKQIELGYAITTHKSQGSEFDVVVLAMTGNMAFLLNRRNFYTAVTRAKREVYIITDRLGMTRAMRPYKG